MSTISESGQNTDASYEIRTDRAKNTLYLELNGALTADEIQTAANETVEVAERLDDGFGIINDISEFTPPSPEAAKPIEEAQATLKQLGVGDVVRVVADETRAVTENAFQRRSRKAGYEGKTATTVDEAERKLEL